VKPARTDPIVIVLPDWFRAPIDVSKELHVMLPIALCGLLAMLVSPTIGGFFFLVPYSVTCCAVGAMAIGHDFTHRTFGTILVLPVPRQRLWWSRIKPAAIIVLGLAVAAFLLGCAGGMGNGWQMGYWRRYVLPPIFSALCLAPWLTLISRSVLFGTIFSAAIPSFIWAISEEIGRRAGVASPEYAAEQFRTFAMPVLWIVGAVLGWTKFMTLEVIDGALGGRVGKATRSAARQHVRRSSVTWQLFKKEIMLQKFSLGLAAVTMGVTSLLNSEQTALWTLVYPMALVVVIGSISCAEERQLGTAEWQALLPIAPWKQWLIKFVTTFGLAAICGIVLPLLLLGYKTEELRRLHEVDFKRALMVFAACLFMFTVMTMYVSSLCNSGLKAVMTAVWVNLLGGYLVMHLFVGYTHFLWTQDAVRESWLDSMQQDVNSLSVDQMHGDEWWMHEDWWLRWQFSPFLLSIFGVLGLAMVFAMRNQRSAERGPYRALRQVATLGGFQAAATLATYIFWNWYSWLR
jgi:hypothetical protein